MLGKENIHKPKNEGLAHPEVPREGDPSESSYFVSGLGENFYPDSVEVSAREASSQLNFLQDVVRYGAQVKQFTGRDWLIYVGWVGMMLGLLFSTLGFVLIGHLNGVDYPAYVWSVPVGTFIFVVAIAFDTIGHRTAYKEVLQKGESLVHGITIFAGVTSCLLLCLAYTYPELMMFPVITFIALSIVYSLIDEALHWHRYLSMHSDRVEMWSHFFIFVGHTMFILSWYYWYDQGYPGVAETLEVMKSAGIF